MCIREIFNRSPRLAPEEIFVQSFDAHVGRVAKAMEEKRRTRQLADDAREKFLTETFWLPEEFNERVQPILDLALYVWTRESVRKMVTLHGEIFPRK